MGGETEIWVLGCGPSLAKVEIPDVLTVGVNRSFRVKWSPIWVTAGFTEVREMFREARPLAAYVTKWRKPLPRTTRLTERFTKSGSLGYYVATLLNPERIRLVGFDMETDLGHFYPEGPAHRHSGSPYRPGYYLSMRKELRQIYETKSIPTYIWQRGEWLDLNQMEAT